MVLKCDTGVLFYSLWKASFRFLAQLFDVSPATGHDLSNEISMTAETLGEPVVAEGIEEIEIDQRWHFLGAEKQNMDTQGARSSHRENCRRGCR